MGILQTQAPSEESIDIAVVGLSCRFPGGASDPQKFWELLSNKQSAAGTVPDNRYNVNAFHHEAREKLNTLSACQGHFIQEDVAAFDAPFFNITSQEAIAMDPTARILLEVTYEAIESAGLPIENLAGSDTSCYVGCFTRDWHEMLMRDAETAPMYSGTGTGFSLLSNRISWFYDMRGPSMTLDTACSSSLVGLHLACQGLRRGESKIAVVCGANLILSPDLGMWLSNLRMTSTDGLSRSFAEGVTGYGRGEGIATLIIKPLKDAMRTGDPIRAVIRGTGVNQDGHTTGITVPNSEAQADLIRSTYQSAGLDVSQTSYFEAHGTGTAVGDPLELGAVAQAISTNRAADDPLYVGSVKSNIGHLEGAAGLAGVIKCILMLEKGVILPNIHFDRPNERIPFDDWRIKVPIEVIQWPDNRLKRASVNSFGYGGTNAHVILDNPNELTDADARMARDEPIVNSKVRTRLFVFSAPAEAALRRRMKRMNDFLSDAALGEEGTYLEQLAYTLSDRRTQFPWRAVAVASSISELKQSLTTPTLLAHAPQKARLAFVFTGQGAQWARMGSELFAYPVFRQSVVDADAYLRSHLGSEWSVLEELERDASSSQINLAQLSQPLCTVLQVAMVELLTSWGIEPVAVVGHSSGEIAAAYSCGALSRKDAWKVAYYRGKACSMLSYDPAHIKGAMMAVGLSSNEAMQHIKTVKAGTVVVACVNSPSSVTVSGDAVGIEDLQQKLATAGVFHRRLQVEHAYHSYHMQRVANAYLDQISTIDTQNATSNTVPIFSSVTGMRISPEQLGSAYWVRNLVSPVLFLDAVSTMLQDAGRRRRRLRPGESVVNVLLEIGPHGALKGPLHQILQHHSISSVTYTSVLQRGEDAIQCAARAIGQLYVHGVPLSISVVNCLTTKPQPLVDLPSYPWDHSLRYWAESRLSRNYRFRKFGRHDLLGAPAADASVKQPRWRNILRVQEQSWLREHVVHSNILFPASGSIVMVLEAVQQLVTDRRIESIKLEKIRITKAIVIPDSQAGIEVVLELHHNETLNDRSQDSWEFIVQSCSDSLALEQNSTGVVIARYASEKKERTAAWTAGKKFMWKKATEEYDAAVKHCIRTVSPGAFYEATSEAGLQYGALFQGLTEISAGSGRCITVVNITNTKASMAAGVQSVHLIHPTTLDVIFHSMFTALGGDKLDFQNAAVPIGFDSIVIYMDLPSAAGDELRSCCHIKRDGSRDLVGDIYVSDMSWKTPKIIVTGIRCRELPGINTRRASHTSSKAPVGTLVWKPDFALLNEAALRDYLSANLKSEGSIPTWESEVGTIVDLAAHKNPDISILQIGHSDVLVNFHDADSKTVNQCRDMFQQQSDILSFELLNIEAIQDNFTWKENTFDLVIVCAGVLPEEQLYQVKGYIRAGGTLIAQRRLGDSPLLSSPYVSDNEVTDSWTLWHCSPTSSWILSRKQPEVLPSPNRTVLVIEPAEPNMSVLRISHQLSLELAALGLLTETVRWSSKLADPRGKAVISLLELQAPFLRDISSDDYSALRSLVLNSARLLWLAMGGDPAMQAAIGYLRVLQNENINLDLRYLLLKENPGRSLESIVQIIAPVVVAPTTDREYTELTGCLHVNRWMNDAHLSRIMTRNGQNEPETLRLGDLKMPLRLLPSSMEATKPRTLYGALGHGQEILAADDVEVEVKAIAARPGSERFAIGLGGIVTKSGASCSRLKPGDRVWGCAWEDAVQTHYHICENLLQQLPPESTFEDGADWVITLGSAYIALLDMARLQTGQSVLIQAAGSAIGQYAVQLAQLENTTIIATVRSEEERHLVQDLGVDPDCVLGEDDPDLEAAISGLTQSNGVDVTLNQSSDPKSLLCLWNCVAASGVLVAINPESSSDNASWLSVAPLRRGASYREFDFSNVLAEDPARMKAVFERVSEIRLNKTFQAPLPRTRWGASQAAEAFQWASSHPGNIAILSFDLDDYIPITPDAANPLMLDADATYLIVGGTGGLGANVATFLAQKGARHLAIISRSGPASKNGDIFTQRLASRGVKVGLYAADASDQTAMRKALAQCAVELPPLGGVIQSAAVLDDAIYNNMTHKQWENAIRPKIHGSWILHQLLPRDLQFFVMLSSIAGLVGNRSQANYAAGNTYQDALAHYRRSQGLPAVSIDLGLMLGIGLIAERGGATNLKKWEAVGIHEQEFHTIMTAAIAGTWGTHPMPAQVICGLPTGGILQSEQLEWPFYFDDPRFAYLKRQDFDNSKDKEPGSNTKSLSSQLGRVQSVRDAVDIVTIGLSQRLAIELQINVESIDSSRPLHSYGVDSLSMIEIRNWILSNLQAELSLFDLLNGGSIHALATRIAAISKAVPDTVH
ncbi:hypothetical protein BDV06DRAFT_227771 [Aspergillus oleicola]